MEYQRASAAAAFSKKLSNGHGLRGKGIYDGVFSGQSKVGSRVEDYGEIFGGSGSSIPILDIPELNERKVSMNVRSSKLDYSKIFGGFGEFDFAVSHEELVAKPKKQRKTWAKSRSHSEGLWPSNSPVAEQDLSKESSHQSLEGVKQSNVSYNKTIPGSRIKMNGTTHVAQFHEASGYSCSIDEITQPQKTVDEKPASSEFSDAPSTLGVNEESVEVRHYRSNPHENASKQTSQCDDELKHKPDSRVPDVNAEFFDKYDVRTRAQPSKVSPASGHLKNGRNITHKSSRYGFYRSYSVESIPGPCSPPYFEEEVDANSTAAASAAALKKAIEKAQIRIKMAKELMERKRESHQNCMKVRFDDGLSMKKKDRSDKMKANKFREMESQEPCEKTYTRMQTFPVIRSQNDVHVSKAAQDSGDTNEIFVSNKAVGERNGENIISSQFDHMQQETGQCETKCLKEEAKQMMQSISHCEREDNNTTEKPGECSKISEAIDEAHQEEPQRKVNAVMKECDLRQSPNKLESSEDVHDQRDDGNEPRSDPLFDGSKETIELSNEVEACEEGLEEAEMPACNGPEKIHDLKDNDSLTRLQDAEMLVNQVIEEEDSGGERKDIPEWEGNQTIVEDVFLQEELGRVSSKDFEMVSPEKKQNEPCGVEENKEAQDRGCNSIGDTVEVIEVPETLRLDDFHFGTSEKFEKDDELMKDEKENGELVGDVHQITETEGDKMTPKCEEIYEICRDDFRVEEEKINVTEEVLNYQLDDKVASSGAYNQEEIDNLTKLLESCMHEQDSEDLEITVDSARLTEEKEASREFVENIMETKAVEVISELVESEQESEAAEQVHNLVEKGEPDATCLDEEIFELDETQKQIESETDVHVFEKNDINIQTTDMYFEESNQEECKNEFEVLCSMDNKEEELSCKSEEYIQDTKAEVTMGPEGNKCASDSSCESWNDILKNIEVAKTCCTLQAEEDHGGIAPEVEASQRTENNAEKLAESLTEEAVYRKNTSQEMEMEREHRKKIDEAKEKEREREKERIAVERAIREARERAFAEACERASAERANAEARRKVTPEGQGKLDRDSVNANDKASIKAKLRAERAAVERATAEARERALERALSEKAAFEARNQSQKFGGEKTSGAFRENGTKQTVPPYDVHYKGSVTSGNSRYTNSSNQTDPPTSEKSDSTIGETAQRCKARLERHQRTAERAAKALAEKNMRDLLAQKEQAERNRLAESLDAEVKRWSSGKEGNLRALLSTLQYILGSDSGWQPIPLTDIIATAAVKKAYRKATLFVHPDKLQQRGASIQQKYTCEKVFDLLKEAWNKFSAEER